MPAFAREAADLAGGHRRSGSQRRLTAAGAELVKGAGDDDAGVRDAVLGQLADREMLDELHERLPEPLRIAQRRLVVHQAAVDKPSPTFATRVVRSVARVGGGFQGRA